MQQLTMVILLYIYYTNTQIQFNSWLTEMRENGTQKRLFILKKSFLNKWNEV